MMEIDGPIESFALAGDLRLTLMNGSVPSYEGNNGPKRARALYDAGGPDDPRVRQFVFRWLHAIDRREMKNS